MDNRVLVVGTTSDYIDLLRAVRPGEVLFVTDPDIRRRAVEPAPGVEEEILCDLRDPQACRAAISAHMAAHKITPVGITAYDCESMLLAAFLADQFSLSYPSATSVQVCREKDSAKALWQERGIASPRFALIASVEEGLEFFRDLGKPCVLKPTCGSGSELVYLCGTEEDIRENFSIIRGELEKRQGNRLLESCASQPSRMVMEEYVHGEEYSCDFLFDGEKAALIRVARKLKAPEDPFGTIRGYLLPGIFPEKMVAALLPRAIADAAKALHLSRCMGMADFILEEGRIVFLEMTPRPGGDCLPDLLKEATGADILGMALDFAADRPIFLPFFSGNTSHVGLRIHGKREGIVGTIDDAALRRDPRVLKVAIVRKPGDRILLPPADYDSWLIGHVIFKPTPGADPADECEHLIRMLTVTYAEDA